MSKIVQDTPAPPPLMGTQLVPSLPAPLTIALVALAPQIHFVRWILEAGSWRADWEDSWLLLAAWWGVCLTVRAVFRYALPIFAVSAWYWWRMRTVWREAQRQPATEESLQQAVTDLTVIRTLFPAMSSSTRAPPTQQDSPLATTLVTPLTVLRVLAFCYPPYLLLTLTHLLRLRTLVAIIGTLVLTYRAPFASLIRRALWRSAYLRWGVYWAWSQISGTPLPPPIRPEEPQFSMSTSGDKHNQASIRFLFTVYENQRWWMGLDWTAALLPAERPSWCTRALQPCSPPAAFSLPPPTTVYLPDASAAKKGRAAGKNLVMRRTARWAWEELEWRVVVRKEGTSSNTRVERPLPSLVEEGPSASAGRILRAAGKIRGASVDLSPERKKDVDGGLKEKEHGKERDNDDSDRDEKAVQGHDEDAEPFTDADGWVYGDNKWEGGSAKGGMGKYTRYRRWSRVAVLSEMIEWIDESEVPDEAKKTQRHSMTLLPDAHISARVEPQRQASVPAGGHSRDASTSSIDGLRITTEPSEYVSGTPASPTSDDRSRLRQRLKAVVNGTGH